MRRLLLAVVVAGALLTGCTPQARHSGAGAPDGPVAFAHARAEGRRAAALADRLLDAVQEHVPAARRAGGWGGGWADCGDIAGMSVRYTARMSFLAGIEPDDRRAALVEARRVLDADRHPVTAYGDGVTSGSLGFDDPGYDSGLDGGLVLGLDYVKVDVSTACLEVDEADGARLIALPGP